MFDLVPEIWGRSGSPLVFSHTLESFLFSIGILRSFHDCVYPSSLQGRVLFEESKDSVVQWWILYFLVLLEVAFQHFVRDLYALFPCPVTAGIVHLFQGPKCSSMDPRFINSTWLICIFSKTKMASGQLLVQFLMSFLLFCIKIRAKFCHSPLSFPCLISHHSNNPVMKTRNRNMDV